MDEWQKRMKAEKESERQKKNETADMLRSFRGGDLEEAKKLKAAKDEERRKKEEAQRALQDYKGNDMEELKKLKALREEEQRQKQEAQSQLHDYKAKEMDDIGIHSRRGSSHPTHREQVPIPVNRENDANRDEQDLLVGVSVSERAAALAALASKSENIPVPSSGYLNNSKREMLHDNFDPVVESSTVPQEDNLIANESPNDMFVTETPETATVHCVSSDSNGQSKQANSIEDLVVKSNDEISKHKDEHKDENLTKSNQASTTNSNVESIDSPEHIRVDVMFSFGLVTAQLDPPLDAYIDAVEKVVDDAIQGDLDLSKKVLYNKSHRPFVRNTEWDRT